MNTDYMNYYNKKEELLEKQAGVGNYADDLLKMLGLSRKANKLGRTPIYNLRASMERSDAIGSALGEAKKLVETAKINSDSITKSYGFANKDTNPLSLYSQAKQKLKDVPDLLKEDFKNSILQSAARHSDPKIHAFAQGLAKDNKLMDTHVKKLMHDAAAGKELTLHIPNVNGMGKHVKMNIDSPLASYSGSPILNTKDVLGIDGINSFNSAVGKLKNSDDIARGKKFGEVFAEKLKMRDPFTIRDLNTYEKAETYLNSPFVKDIYKSDRNLHKEVTNDILNAVKNNSGDIEKTIKTKLSELASDPRKASYLDMLKLKRLDSTELKKLIETTETPRSRFNTEAFRLAFDATGAVSAGVGAAAIGYSVVNQKSQNDLMMEARQKYLTHTK